MAKRDSAPVLWQSSGQNRRMPNDVALRPQSRWV